VCDIKGVGLELVTHDLLHSYFALHDHKWVQSGSSS